MKLPEDLRVFAVRDELDQQTQVANIEAIVRYCAQIAANGLENYKDDYCLGHKHASVDILRAFDLEELR